MLNKNQLSKIGIGTWGIGGFDKRNPENNDVRQIEALAYAFSKGFNFFETAFWYSEGWAAKLTAQALKKSGKKREEIFISQAIYPYRVANLAQAKKEVEDFEKLFETEYMDTMVFPMGGVLKFSEEASIRFFQDMLHQKKTRFVSITNVDLAMLKRFHKTFGDRLFLHELTLSFEIRANEDLGIIQYARDNGILNVIFQPLRRNRTANHNWELLRDLSNKYHKTQNQIIINWLVSRGFLPLIKSENKDHIDENLSALDFKMEDSDIERLNTYRVPGYKTSKIDWTGSGDGVPIFMLPNTFDEEYEKQK